MIEYQGIIRVKKRWTDALGVDEKHIGDFVRLSGGTTLATKLTNMKNFEQPNLLWWPLGVMITAQFPASDSVYRFNEYLKERGYRVMDSQTKQQAVMAA
jgi:hypothetical protein